MFYTYEELEQPVKYGVEIDKFEDMDEALYYLQFGMEDTLGFAEDNLDDVVMIDLSIEHNLKSSIHWAVNEWEVMSEAEAADVYNMFADDVTDSEERYLYTDADLQRTENKWLLIDVDEVKWNINDLIKQRYTLDEVKELLK